MVREPADLTGLSSQVDAAFADTYKSPWVHAPGDADCVDESGELWGDREHAFGPVAFRDHGRGGALMSASTPPTCR